MFGSGKTSASLRSTMNGMGSTTMGTRTRIGGRARALGLLVAVAAFIGLVAFGLFTVVAAAAVPLVVLLRRPPRPN